MFNPKKHAEIIVNNFYAENIPTKNTRMDYDTIKHYFFDYCMYNFRIAPPPNLLEGVTEYLFEAVENTENDSRKNQIDFAIYMVEGVLDRAWYRSDASSRVHKLLARMGK